MREVKSTRWGIPSHEETPLNLGSKEYHYRNGPGAWAQASKQDMCLRLLEKRGGQVAVNSENTMEEIVKHVLTTMTCSVWLDCKVQERKSGHQGGRRRLRLASEFHCEYLKQQSHTGWMERGDESSQQVSSFSVLTLSPHRVSPDPFWEQKGPHEFFSTFSCTLLMQDTFSFQGKINHGNKLGMDWYHSEVLLSGWKGQDLCYVAHLGSLPLPSLPPWASVSHTPN